MKNIIALLLCAMLAGCAKDAVILSTTPGVTSIDTVAKGYVTYRIAKGDHYCDRSTSTLFTGTQRRCKVLFDSSAVYQTVNPGNQGDINKLYGFTEGINNHLNSARIGWNWRGNALRLYAYAYAAGARHYLEIATVEIGQPVSLAIGIAGNEYHFWVNEQKVILPRAVTSTIADGYLQYPYFGGDEVAPHLISIKLLEVE